MNELTEFEQEVFEYLDALRDSGVTNMYGAAPYVQAEFAHLVVNKYEARDLCKKWRDTFSERHGDTHD